LVIETTIALLLIFGVLVVAHEWGHFIVARMCGIRVEVFAFGWGPRIARMFVRKGTEYTLHAFPIGGFVKLAGMEPGQEDILDGFQAQTAWKRALVIFAGPFMSFVLAAVIFVVVGVFWGFPGDRTTNRVAQAEPKTIAHRIGLRAGDTILSINGKRVTNGKQMVDIIHAQPGVKLRLEIKRNGHVFPKTAAPGWQVIYLDAAWMFMDPKGGVIGKVVEKTAAYRAGLETDDRLVRINGKRITSGGQMVDAIKANGVKPIELIVLRDGKEVTVKATPPVEWVRFAGVKWSFPGGYAEFEGKSPDKRTGVHLYDELATISGAKIETGQQMLDAIKPPCAGSLRLEVKREKKVVGLKPIPGSACETSKVEWAVYSSKGIFGFTPAPVLEKVGFVESVTTGLSQTGRMLMMVIQALSPSRISENVGGPLMIAKQTSSMVALGTDWVIRMAGMLSMSLAVINLVPIPAVLDGGHIILIAIEGIRRKRFTPAQMAVLQTIGLALIGMLIIAVLWSDVFKLSQGLVPQ